MKKKKNMKIFLPGFHTGTDWKITIAIIYYIVVVMLAMTRGLQKGIIFFIALMAASYLAYGFIGLFAKEKKPVMSAVYILISLVVIAGDGVFMNVSGLSVSDVMKVSSADNYSASSSSKTKESGGSSSKQASSSKQSTSKKEKSSETNNTNSTNSTTGTKNTDNTDSSGTDLGGNINQMTEADLFDPEAKIDNSLNENVFDTSENKAEAIQLYYVEKRSMIYHKSSDCSSLANKKVYTVTADEVKRRVMIPCGKCAAE